ncbi:hypothetical protein RJ640_028849 [Escallonia rubra]|uniref:Guanylate kinase-like domain-containing protein n=1 Tax=Escallonia rubra TaxID=112253 RepID=A0AA88U3U3_9ASTE|nr:hypothetical protein RJ640_028849 [Escallonia rubra]
MREGASNGKGYFFVSKEEFLAMVEREELLEYALVYGDYKGIPKQQIREFMAKGRVIVLRLDIEGAATLRRILGRGEVGKVGWSGEAIIDAEKARVRQRNAVILGWMVSLLVDKAWLQMAANSVFHEWTKHIETALHFICQRIQSRVLVHLSISTNHQLAGIFTKALGWDRFHGKRCRCHQLVAAVGDEEEGVVVLVEVEELDDVGMAGEEVEELVDGVSEEALVDGLAGKGGGGEAAVDNT